MNAPQALALLRSREVGLQPQRASVRDWANVLATFPLFASVKKRQLRKLVREATFAEFAPGEPVLAGGRSDESLYIILGGAAKADERPAPRVLRAGDYFGELALIDGAPRSTAIIATQELHVMKLPRQAIVGLAAQHAAISVTMFKNLSRQLRRLEAQAAS